VAAGWLVGYGSERNLSSLDPGDIDLHDDRIGSHTMTATSVSAPPTDAPAPPRGSDFAHLSRLVKAEGLMERRRGYYLAKIALAFVLLAAGVTAMVILGNSWWQLAVAAYFAALFTQLGFLGHDAGHQQIFTSRKANDLVGLLCANLAVGLSYGWWVDKHVRHHANPNDEDRDPDVGAGALIFTTRQAEGAGRPGRLLYRYQAWTFFPLLTLEAINLHVSSVRHLMRRGEPGRGREAVLFGGHILGYLALVFSVMSPVHALVFIGVHQALFGLYLGCSFAPNHKGMPAVDAKDRACFLRRQVLTSRNVRRHWLTDAVLGGLNYQIEHHLFPSMPRPNLRQAQPIVERFCADVGVQYLQTGPVSSYVQALRHLNVIGRAARVQPA
jgi:fatty acid desaturase